MSNDFSERDRHFMQRAIALARRAAGQTAPNPLVGAVIVRGESEVIGEGWHPKAGEPHAEVFALRSVGNPQIGNPQIGNPQIGNPQRASETECATQGATVYVNLEPCSHHGRTPPCVEALIAAQVAHVVVGMVDPNPQVAGNGIAKLREAGIAVTVGVEEEACRELNAGFIERMVRGRSLGILKYAMTLDGKIATTTGHSAWISSSTSRQWVHQLRASCEAVVIGGNTVRRDNPQLTSHGQGANPLRVVMSRTLDLPLDAQLWQTKTAPTVIFIPMNQPPLVPDQLRQLGVEVVELETVTPAKVMANLYHRGCLSVLWECGGTLAAAAIADGSIQKVVAFVAPKIIGGLSAPAPVGDLGLTQMTEALQFERVQWQVMGEDLRFEGYLHPKTQ